MKKLLPVLLALVMLFSLAACGGGASSSAAPVGDGSTAAPAESTGGDDAASTEAPAGDGADVKIGILIPGSPTDGGFSQAAAEAGNQIKDTYGYSVAVVEAPDAETIKSEGETMAAEGYAIVFGHGGQCSTPLAEISPDYPDTWFITFGGTEILDNQFPVCMNAEEGFYVEGVVAGMMTETNKIAWSVGGDYPAYTKTTNGWELGAKSVNPGIEIMSAVLSATDATEGYETTMNQIQSGADFIISNSNEAQAGAMKAVAESEGVYTFGSIGNFTESAPTQVIANVVCDYGAGYLAAIEAVMNGTAKAEIMYLTINSGAVKLAWNEDVKATLPKDVVAAAEEAYEAIKAGEIKVPTEYELG